MTLQSSTTERLRLGNLDHLRGLSALCIMIYHYATWSSGELSARSFLGRMGIYGVAIFYVLSGLTLAYVYQNSFSLSSKGLKDFFRKRFFRIFPLLWLATIISIILSKKIPLFIDVLLNISGLFSFFKWDTYFATGAWSIGNELVFYSVFPILLITFNTSKYALYLISFLFLGLQIFFAFFIINSNKNLSEQWHFYTNPLNQIFFFWAGIMLCKMFYEIRISKLINTAIGVIGLLLLLFYPSNIENINLVTGVNRIIFTISCIMICLFFYKIQYQLPSILDKGLAFLGRASYSVYLLHPIVYAVVKASLKILSKNFVLSESYLITVSIIATLCTSHFVYKYFETYFINAGRRKQHSTN